MHSKIDITHTRGTRLYDKSFITVAIGFILVSIGVFFLVSANQCADATSMAITDITTGICNVRQTDVAGTTISCSNGVDTMTG